MKFVLLLHMLVMLLGCNSELAELSPLRKTRLKIRPTLPTAITADKIMLWATNTNGSSFARIIQAEQETEFIMGNGSYTLYAIAWTAPNLTGDVYCSTIPASLTGPDTSMNLNLTNDGCDVTHFRGAALSGTTPKTLGDVSVQWCETLSNITGAANDCSDDLASGTRKEARGHAMSYRYVIKTFDKIKNRYTLRSDEIQSLCLTGTPDGASPLHGLAQMESTQIPSGDGSTTPFYVTLETFPGSSACSSSTHGVRSLTFENGLIKDSSKTKYIADGAVAHKLYVKMSTQEICSGSSLTQTFAGGDGSRGSPYLICNETQFYNMHTTPSSSFKLMNDIDLTRYYYGKTTLPNIPDGLTCLHKGSNFYPLGYDNACNFTANTFATNDFDGGGKTLKGLRIYMPDHTRVGLFIRKHGGEIRRLKITDSAVTGSIYVGTLAALTQGKFRDIIADNNYLRATTDQAGILVGGNGAAADCEFRNIRVTRANIHGGAFIGGVIGQSNSCDFYNVSSSGFVFGSGANIGGIAGNLTSGTMNEVSFEGNVQGLTSVGGISGDLFNGYISNSYVVGAVLGSKSGNDVRAGGLVGFTNGGTATAGISNSYFFGQMNHYCTGGVNCGVSNIVGDPGGWGAADLNTNAYVSTNSITGFAVYDAGVPFPQADFFSSLSTLPGTFIKSDSDLPRLSHEVSVTTSDLRHPCQTSLIETASIPTQIVAGRGTSENPISLCNFSQVKAMQTDATTASKFYKMQTFILTTEELSASSASFTGNLDGNLKGIVRLTVSANTGQNTAWWDSIGTTGVMKNLYIIDARIIDMTNDAATTALIARANYGELNAVHTLATRSTPGPVGEHSLYVHTNFGRIIGSYVNGSATVRKNVAVTAYNNQNLIEDGWSTSYLACNAAFDCTNISGTVIENSGTIRRTEVVSTIFQQLAVATRSDFSFVAQENTGTIEDIHIKAGSKITSKSFAAHGIVAENTITGSVSRVYNEGRILVYNAALPSTSPITVADYVDGATNSIGYSLGSFSNIAYRYVPRWSFPSQYGYIGRVVSGASECQYDLNGDYGAAWDTVMSSGLFTRFGVMVTDEEREYPFTIMPTLAVGADKFWVYDTAPCSMTVGNPTLYFVPFDQFGGTQSINQAESLMYATFSAWNGVLDVTTDLSPIHDYLYDRFNGVSSSKPVWIFDTTNSLRLYR